MLKSDTGLAHSRGDWVHSLPFSTVHSEQTACISRIWKMPPDKPVTWNRMSVGGLMENRNKLVSLGHLYGHRAGLRAFLWQIRSLNPWHHHDNYTAPCDSVMPFSFQNSKRCALPRNTNSGLRFPGKSDQDRKRAPWRSGRSCFQSQLERAC